MTLGRTIFFTRRHHNGPRTLAGSLRELPAAFINFWSSFVTFNIHHFPSRNDENIVFSVCLERGGAISRNVFDVGELLSGGDMVDGLPPAFSFGPRHHFLIFISLVLWRGKFVLAKITFPAYFV